MRLEPVTTGAALVLQQLVVEGEAADEHPDIGARQSVGGHPPVLQRLPRGLQQQTLLRIERVRFARGHPEELGIELIDLAEESASAGDDLADLRRVRVVVSVGVPPCLGDDGGGVGLVAQQVPESSSAESAPPGRRHPIPTIANGRGCCLQ